MGNGLGSLVWFIAILALIPLSLRWLKRTPLGGAGARGVLRSIATLPVSTSQRIVTVEVGSGAERRWLVLGVTPASITTLHTMAAQDVEHPADAPADSPPAFARVLARLRRPEKDAARAG